MESKRLEIGDKLYSVYNWNFKIVTIITVTDTEALSDSGIGIAIRTKALRFARDFTDGCLGCIDGFSIYLNEWYLDSNQPNLRAEYIITLLHKYQIGHILHISKGYLFLISYHQT